MKNYVVGFLFNYYMNSVLLMKKNRPEWQKGNLNGMGGHIEKTDKTILDAMKRECFEESGLDIEWIYLGVSKGIDPTGEAYKCNLFYANTNLIYTYEQKEDEIFNIYQLDHLKYYDKHDSIEWLIPLIRSHYKSRKKFTIEVKYH